MLPGLKPTGELTPGDGGHPWGANCSKVAAAQPHTTLLLDVLMVENYAPSPDEHAGHDHGALREEVPWEPVFNCDGSYTMEEHIARHKPPSILLTNMWMSTVVANTVSQLVFANSEPSPMEGGPPLAIGDKASQWGSKTSWMLFDQVRCLQTRRLLLRSSILGHAMECDCEFRWTSLSSLIRSKYSLLRLECCCQACPRHSACRSPP